MIKNYLKLGFRNLAKNRLSSAINLVGLALAVGCCLVVFEFFDWAMHMDNFHRKTNNLFVIEKRTQKDGNMQLWGNSPAPMGPVLKANLPQFKSATRVTDKNVVIRQGDNIFRENVSFVDNSFYDNFDFPIQWGNKDNFADEEAIVLTNELAGKLFGSQNPVGKTIALRMNVKGTDELLNFKIAGVMAKEPAESSWYFSSLISYKKLTALGIDDPANWSESTDITFLELDNASSLPKVQSHVKGYVIQYNEANPNDKIVSFNVQPLRLMNMHTYQVKNNRFAATNMIGFIMLFTIAIATLLLVYFNYTNIAIASASTRLKEIGIRKVMGSARVQIVLQFLVENMILCAIAVLAGLLLAKFIFIPWFYQLSNIRFADGLFVNYRTWVALIVLALLSAIGGATYPAVYISAFYPVNILKGNNKTGNKNRFRKFLLGFQFFLTFLAMTIAISLYIGNENNKKQILGIRSEGQPGYQNK